MSLDHPGLSDIAREMIADLDNQLLLNSASYWEIGIKLSTGKYTLSESLDAFMDREIERNQLIILPITPQHASQVSRLPFHHRDPFDRMLIAQSIVENTPILSADKAFDAYSIDRRW